MSSRRRETASAQAPDGTSSTRLLPDQMTNSDVICQTESPVSAKSSAYTGYSRTRSSRNEYAYRTAAMRRADVIIEPFPRETGGRRTSDARGGPRGVTGLDQHRQCTARE